MKTSDVPRIKPCEKCGENWWDLDHMRYVNGKWIKFMVCTKCGNEIPYETIEEE